MVISSIYYISELTATATALDKRKLSRNIHPFIILENVDDESGSDDDEEQENINVEDDPDHQESDQGEEDEDEEDLCLISAANSSSSTVGESSTLDNTNSAPNRDLMILAKHGFNPTNSKTDQCYPSKSVVKYSPTLYKNGDSNLLSSSPILSSLSLPIPKIFDNEVTAKTATLEECGKEKVDLPRSPQRDKNNNDTYDVISTLLSHLPSTVRVNDNHNGEAEGTEGGAKADDVISLTCSSPSKKKKKKKKRYTLSPYNIYSHIKTRMSKKIKAYHSYGLIIEIYATVTC